MQMDGLIFSGGGSEGEEKDVLANRRAGKLGFFRIPEKRSWGHSGRGGDLLLAGDEIG